MKGLFIVGNSRSGTSMLSRIMGKHTRDYTIPHEIHFFEEQWDPEAEQTVLTQRQANNLLSWLLCVSREGYLKHGSPGHYRQEAEKHLEGAKNPSAIEVYTLFLSIIAKEHRVDIVCEQTPRYLLFSEIVLKYFPDAYILNMVRDPRDILLSQKKNGGFGILGQRM